jgi:hypothetical protein
VLKIDRQQTIEGVTVWGDSDSHATFYLLSSDLSYRLDDNGKPAFKFVEYRFAVDRPDGKKGGGYVFFDLSMKIPKEKEDRIRAQLQAGVNTVHQTGQPPEALRALFGRGVAGTSGPPPTVELGSITFTRGTCNLLLSDSTGTLIQKVGSAATPMLYADNVAAFSLELTPEGAALFKQTMQGEGVGGVAVVYDMRMWAQLPPLTGRAWFYGSEFYSFAQKIDIDRNRCGDDSYVQQVREELSSAETMGVEIHADFTFPNDPEGKRKDALVESVRSSLQRSLEETVARKALKPIDPVAAEKRELPEGDFQHVTRDLQLAKDVTWTESYTETSTVEWNVAPQGNVPNITSMKGPDGKPFQWKDYAVMVDLDDPFYKQLNVTVQVNADFQALPIHSVEVNLEYKEGATHQIRGYHFTDPAKIEKFATYMENDVRDYEWWYVVNYKGSARTFRSERTKTSEQNVTVNVDDLGILHVDIEVGDLDFDVIASAQVTFEYDTASGKLEDQFILDKANRTASVRKPIFEPRVRPYRSKTKLIMADGNEYEGEWVEGYAAKLFINDTFTHTKTVSVRAAGDLQNEIDTIFVDLAYEDSGQKFKQTASTALSATSRFYDWVFRVPGEGKGVVSYSGEIRRRNGTIESIPETVATTPTIMVGEILADKLAVTVLGDLLDFKQIKLAKVALRYEDPAHGVHQVKDMIFREGSPEQTWEVELKDRAQQEYTWAATYFLADGSQRTTGPERSSEPTVLLQFPGPVPGVSQPKPPVTPFFPAGDGTPA